MPKINLKRKTGVVGTSTQEKVMERFLNMDVVSAPTDQAQHDLAGDTFHYVYKRAPKLLDEVPPERATNKAVLEWLEAGGLDRSITSGKVAASLASAGVMWYGMTQDKVIQEALEAQRKADEEAQKAAEAERQAAEIAKQAAEQPGGLTDEQQQAIAAAAETASQARARAQAAGEKAKDVIDKARDNPIKKHAATKIAKAANEAAENVNEMMSTWGIGDGELSESADIEKIVKMASERKISELTRMFGRFRGMARRTISGVRSGKAGAIPRVEDTRDIERIFAYEAAQMSRRMPTPVSMSAVRRFVERGLPGFVPQIEGKESGSFVAYVDESGSIGNELCALEKALCLAIASALRDEVEDDRPWEMYGFDSNVRAGVTNSDSWINVLNWCTLYHSGGTRIGKVLKHAVGRIREMAANQINGVDVVIITDGEDYIEDEDLAEYDQAAAEIGTRLIYIHLGYGKNDELEKRAALFIHTENVKDFGKMADDILVQISELIASR